MFGIRATCGALIVLLASVAGMASAPAEPPPESSRYIEQADRKARAGDFEAAATALRIALAYYSRDGIEPPSEVLLKHALAAAGTGRHAAAARSATRYLLAVGHAGEQAQAAMDLVKRSEKALAQERTAQQARESQARERLLQSTGRGANEVATATAEVGPTACEVPGFPRPDDPQSLGLDWCPSSVGFQLRVFALQAAGGWCALRLGTSSTPDQVAARHEQIKGACDRLDALAGNNSGPSCRCPSGYRP